MRVLTRLFASSTLLVLALAALAAASAGAPSRPASSAICTSTTTPPAANTIAGFARHADGTLTALPGSPFAAGGAGSGAPARVAGRRCRRRADGRFLLAVDAGSNQISVLRIRHDGSLVPVDTGRLRRRAAGQHRRPRPLVYVANAGAGGDSYTGFVLDRSATCPVARARRSRCPTARSRATSCSTDRDDGRRHADRHVADRQLPRAPGRPAGRRAGIADLRPGDSARSAASSARPTRASCSCPTPTTAPASAASRRSRSMAGRR